jgi:acyl CoA:acetate/3-ketoacid CoA transferase beta subunit/acyl CoA:acetate/3-ketoacid CoA transferase alpha subunit
MRASSRSVRAPVMALGDAIAACVEPGMHLHFASTPSRSNAAIREIARRFAGANPGFTLSTSGFHSMAHLLGILRLGRNYISCFFGDNYPSPRPNALYTHLEREGSGIAHWSLGSYTAALRAGAAGERWAIARSLAGTSLAEEMARRGEYREIEGPLEGDRLGLVAAMRPDLCFVHAAAADDRGHVLCSPPIGEGFHAAHAARAGVIVTVDEMVPRAVTSRLSGLVAIAPHRIRAVCLEPWGAHPQPLYSIAGLGLSSYRDDVAHYARWRRMATTPELFADFATHVLTAPDGGDAYRRWVGEPRLASLRADRVDAPLAAEPRIDERDARLVVAAARHLADRVRHRGYPIVLAGIGQSFLAARMAERLLAAVDARLTVIVETGLYDVGGEDADPFLLSWANIARASRLSSVDDALLGLACGGGEDCVAMVGAAEIDPTGAINSARIGGRTIVGSGGAADLVACAAEAIVVVPAEAGRVVPRVSWVMGNGRRVRAIVTDRGTLCRESETAPWHLVAFAPGETRPGDVMAWFQSVGFSIAEVTAAPPTSITAAEAAALKTAARIDVPAEAESMEAV